MNFFPCPAQWLFAAGILLNVLYGSQFIVSLWRESIQNSGWIYHLRGTKTVEAIVRWYSVGMRKWIKSQIEIWVQFWNSAVLFSECENSWSSKMHKFQTVQHSNINSQMQHKQDFTDNSARASLPVHWKSSFWWTKGYWYMRRRIQQVCEECRKT